MRGDRAGQLVLSLISSTACVDSREEIQLKTLDGSAEKKMKKFPSRLVYFSIALNHFLSANLL